jgi:hypothetical protein
LKILCGGEKKMRAGIDKNKIAAILIVALFSLITISTITARNTDGMVSLPRVSVILHDPLHDVAVHPDSSGIVAVNGTVRVEEIWPDGYTDINVVISADAGGWELDLPPSIELTEGEPSKNFTIFLHVPLETSHQTQGSIEVNGNWFSNSADTSGSIISASAIVRPEQYYKFSLSSEERFGSVRGGEEWGSRCRLINEGNGQDRIRMEILNLQNLTDNGITVRLSQDKFQAPEKQERVLTIIVITDNLTVPGNYSIKLRAISAQAEGLGEEADVSDLELFVNVESNVGAEDAPFPGIHLILALIASFSFLIFIKRTGFRK